MRFNNDHTFERPKYSMSITLDTGVSSQATGQTSNPSERSLRSADQPHACSHHFVFILWYIREWMTVIWDIWDDPDHPEEDGEVCWFSLTFPEPCITTDGIDSSLRDLNENVQDEKTDLAPNMKQVWHTATERFIRKSRISPPLHGPERRQISFKMKMVVQSEPN